MSVSALTGAATQQAALPFLVVGVAFLLDMVASELPERVHPVALFGRVVAAFDRECIFSVAAGAVLALVLPLLATLVVWSVTAAGFRVSPLVGVTIAGVLLFSTVSLRMLLDAAREVIALTESSVDDARTAVRALVGRDAESLSPAELRSAAVESAAENLADGLVGPLLAFAIGAQLSVAAGVAAAAYVKAVNTMDSMLGYRSKPVGTASAKLDDLLMWLPARVSALLLAVAAVSPSSLWRARKWAREPSSPNSGWPMATVAAAGDIRLSKPGAYTLNAAEMEPTVEQANACVRTVGVAGIIAFILAGAGASMGVALWS